MHIDYSALPAHLQASAEAYITHGIVPGDIQNELIHGNHRAAYERATDAERQQLFVIHDFWALRAPWICRGSPGAVIRWASLGGIAGQEARKARRV